MKENTHHKLIIYSDKKELVKVESFLSDIFEEYWLSDSNFKNVFLCISEAVVNSIQHGNLNDENKKVSVTIFLRSKQIHIIIKDEGRGFDVNLIEDPTTENNLKKEKGRGIYIIKSLSKAIKYNKTGNKVKIKMDCK